MSAHTPGPWQAMGFGSMVIGPDHYVVCRTQLPPNKDHDQQAANGRLIAVAPELLAALEALIGGAEFSACQDANNPGLWDLCIKARAAIAKARPA